MKLRPWSDLPGRDQFKLLNVLQEPMLVQPEVEVLGRVVFPHCVPEFLEIDDPAPNTKHVLHRPHDKPGDGRVPRVLPLGRGLPNVGVVELVEEGRVADRPSYSPEDKIADQADIPLQGSCDAVGHAVLEDEILQSRMSSSREDT